MTQTETIDLSVIVTAHDETLVSGPTMAAAEAAITRAEADDVRVERLIVLDSPTDQTRTWFTQPRFDHWQKLEIDEGDVGRTRNYAVMQAKGAYIAFLDADDLFSENWLAQGVAQLRKAEAKGQKTIIHPELIWLFEGDNTVYFNPDQTDPLFLPQHFYFMNYYDTLAIAPRAAHRDIPSVSRDIPAGLSFQDWQFSVQSMAAGWVHVSSPDTIIFKRRRDQSLVSESRARRAILRDLDAMAIDRIADLSGPRTLPQHPKSSLLPPDTRPHSSAGKTPYYGAVFHNRITRAQQLNQHQDLVPADQYDLIKSRFDTAFYLARRPDLTQAERVDPVAHYIRAGAREFADPSPLFSTRQYLRRYPDVGDSGQNPFYHWLNQGYAEGRIGAPFSMLDRISDLLGISPQTVQAVLQARYCDLRARLEYGELGAQVAGACMHEPLIAQSWPKALHLQLPPFHSDLALRRTVAICDLQSQADHRRARFVICTDGPKWGAGTRADMHLAASLTRLYGADQVLLVTTDIADDLPDGTVPDGVRCINLAKIVSDFKDVVRQRILVEFLRSLKPEVVFNVNSSLLWQAFKPFGQAMADSLRLVGWLGQQNKTLYGHHSGDPLTQPYRHFDILESLCTDSTALAQDLIDRHAIPPHQQARVQVLHAPVSPKTKHPAAPSHDRPQVFWSGRFDPQRRVDVVYAIARAMPHIDFRLWGKPVLGNLRSLPEKPDNVVLEGVYDRFDDLPLDQADLWLFTAEWDGAPRILQEVAMTGIPLVGNIVGGTGEILRADLVQTVHDIDDIPGWCAAITSVLNDPNTARQHAQSLCTRLMQERNSAAFDARIAALIDAGSVPSP